MNKLLGFRYLHFKHLFALTIILALVSALFLVTSLSFIGFYKSFNAYLGEENDVIAVYDKQSKTPFTGSIPVYLTEQVSTAKGVLVSSPETITPCIVNSQSLFVRGVSPNVFVKLNPIELIEGKTFNQSDLGSVMLGKNLAERLKVNINDKILILAALTDRYLELEVSGVYQSGSIMDDEALVPLNVGQWLRFNDYNHVTLIRAKIDPRVVGADEIYQELAKNAQTALSSSSNLSNQAVNYQEIMPWATIKYQIENLGVKGTQNLMKSYLDRYGITEEALIVLSMVVFLFSSVTVTAASQTLIRQHKEDFETLRYVGASRKMLKVDVLLKLLPLTLVASGLGALITVAALTVLEGYGYLSVLSHRLVFGLDPLILALNFILILVLVAVSVLRSDFE
jgi:ABC-type lipoprotein release transport system permease subunit